MKSLRYIKVMDFFKNLSVGQKLFLITCLGFFIRLYVVFNAVTVSTDSVLYLELAREFSKGNYHGGLNIIRPPLYPMTVSLAYFIFGNLELAGRVVSLFFGTLVIAVGFYLGRQIYNERAGLLTAFFIAIHPYMVRYSGSVLTEGLYHFLVAAVTLLGLKAISSRNIGFMFLTGLLSVLAYLTKPGAIGFPMVISLWVLFYKIRNIKEDWGKRLILLASLWAVFILTALPYLLFLYQETGGVAITGRASIIGTIYSMVTLKFVLNNFGNFIIWDPSG
jgi:4-amino-4-deoxy-L-arabinose transferase-like glycosyltransferase